MAPAVQQALLQQLLSGMDPAQLQHILPAEIQQQTVAAPAATPTRPAARPTVRFLTPEAQQQLNRGGMTAAQVNTASATPAEDKYDAGADDNDGSGLPPLPPFLSLQGKLRELARKQAENEDIKNSLDHQGTTTVPGDHRTILEYLLKVDETIVLCAMAPDSSHIMLLHSMLQYYGGRKRTRFYGKMMSAVGKRKHNGTDPSFVDLKDNHFVSRKVKLPKDKSDNSLIATHFESTEEFYQSTQVKLEDDKTFLPKFPIILASVALKILTEGDITLWNLYEALIT